MSPHLTSSGSHQQIEYRASLWSILLHQVPHVNIAFQRLENDDFRPDSELYLESLGIIGSVPAAWLILTLIVLLIYLLTRCCDTKNNKKRKSRPIRCCLSFFSLVCCSALAGGFYGNHQLHSGTEHFNTAMVNIDRNIQTAQDEVSNLTSLRDQLEDQLTRFPVKSFNDLLQKEVDQNLNRLYDGVFHKETSQAKDAHHELLKHSDFIFYNVTDGLKAMDAIRFQIRDPKTPVQIGGIPQRVAELERLRWPVTMALLGLFSLFCLLLFIGAIVHSRATLIVFSVCGLFSIILLWLLASIYVTMAVALADFCYLPTPWVQTALNTSFNMTKEVSEYYLQCSVKNSESPFKASLQESNQAIQNINTSVMKVVSLASAQYGGHRDLEPALTNLRQASERTLSLQEKLGGTLDCKQLYRFYNDALNAACGTYGEWRASVLEGLFIMLVSASVCAVFFTILVWCNSHTWIYFKHKGKYVKVEDQDPYMPLSTIDRGARAGSMGAHSMGAPVYQRSRNIHTPPQTPPYHGTLNGHGQHGHIMPKNGAMGGNGMAMGANGLPPLPQQPLPGPPTLHAGVGYGHIGTLNRGMGHQMGPATLGPQGFMNPGHAGTLGRAPKQPPMAGYGQTGAATTMTLGRRGHYASLRAARAGDTDQPLLGPNQGQYATLSKGCKTLQNDDFY